MRRVRIEIKQSELERYPVDVVPASLVRQKLIQAGAPEGFNMADVTRHVEYHVIVYTWCEPEPVRYLDVTEEMCRSAQMPPALWR